MYCTLMTQHHCSRVLYKKLVKVANVMKQTSQPTRASRGVSPVGGPERGRTGGGPQNGTGALQLGVTTRGYN